jgi:MATE family multidrug resistance protein
VKALLALAGPMIGASLVTMGMSITDTLMMGWIGPTALAAGAVISDLYSLVFYLAAGVLSMVAVLAARAVGADERDGVRRAVQGGVAAALLMTLPAAAAVWHAADFVRLLGVDHSVPDLGGGYAHAMAITMVPMLLVTVWRNLFGALGRPRIFLVASFCALPLNAVANLILMFGWGPVPALGVTGAGLASALVAFALLVGFATFTAFDTELRGLRLFRLPPRPIFGDTREIFRFGLPVGIFTLGELGLFLIATVVVSLFGAEALAAHAVALRTAGVVYAIPAGLSQAATVRVGTEIGGGEEGNVDRAVDSARTVGIASGLGICTGLVAGSGLIPALFVTPGGDVAATASALLLLLGLLHVAQGLAGPATAVLRAFKDTKRPMQLSLAGYWIVGMPIGALLGFGLNLGVFGIWCGLGVGVLASAVLLNVRLFRSILRPHRADHFLETKDIQAAP